MPLKPQLIREGRVLGEPQNEMSRNLGLGIGAKLNLRSFGMNLD